MDRRLLFPAVAITAWAQQTAPSAAKAEKALRARAEIFYQLQVDQKFRQAEAYVAEDSREVYYAAPKGSVLAATVKSVSFLDKTHAVVKTNVRQVVLMMGVGPQTMELEQTSYWKLEHGKWSWYVDPDAFKQTPFGKMNVGAGAGAKLDRTGEAPPMNFLLEQVVLDKSVVNLSNAAPDGKVTISNNLRGPVQLELDSHVEQIKGVSVTISPVALGQGEKAEVLFRRTGENSVVDVVRITVRPINKLLEIQLTSN